MPDHKSIVEWSDSVDVKFKICLVLGGCNTVMFLLMLVLLIIWKAH